MDLNSLPRLQCPKCGHNRRFLVEGHAQLYLDNGSVYEYQNVTIDIDASCKCVNCRHRATVADFRDARARADTRAANVGDALSRL